MTKTGINYCCRSINRRRLKADVLFMLVLAAAADGFNGGCGAVC